VTVTGLPASVGAAAANVRAYPYFGWMKARRFVVAREREREAKSAVGRRLLDVPGYTFRGWVTNRTESALELWRGYNGRACVEQRREELKHDLAANGFCLQPFFATEAAILAAFLCGAVLGTLGRDVVLKLSAAWGGLGKHKPLVQATLDWLNVASPKLVLPQDRLALGGGLHLSYPGGAPRKSTRYFGASGSCHPGKGPKLK